MGGNIEVPGDSCGFTDPTDLVNVTAAELNLGPLADNGGPTMIHALLPGSVAIDHVPASTCVDAEGEPLTTDQRGVPRPQGAACDAGAFEWADCLGTACDDGNDCTADYCDPADDSWCVNNPLPDGTFCGTDGVCEAGACRERSWSPPVFTATPFSAVENLAVSASGDYIASALVPGEPNPYDGSFQHCLTTFPDLTVHACGWSGIYKATVVHRHSVAIDPAGRGMITWELYHGTHGDTTVQSARFVGDWQQASYYCDGICLIASPVQALVAANGDALLAWSGSGRPYAVRFALSTGWDPEETALSAQQQDDWSYGLALPAIGENGDAMVVYPGTGSGIYNEIWSRRFVVGEGWHEAELVDAEASSFGCSLAMDNEGNATIVCPGWSKRSGRSGGWSTPVSTQAKGDLTADPLGNVFAVWSEGGQIWSSRFSVVSKNWSEPKSIGAGPGHHLAVNAEGNAIMVGATTDGIWWNQFTPIAGWRTPKFIDGTSGTTMPKVALTPDGTAFLGWAQGNQVGVSKYQ